MAKPKSDKPPERRDSDGLHQRRGVWYYSLTINSRRRFFSTRTKNYQDARRIRSTAEAEHEKGLTPGDLAKWPFETLLARVAEDRTPHLSEGTRRLERERGSALLKCFTGRRVSAITVDVIRAWQAKRVTEVSPRTVNLEARLLRNVLRAARTWAKIAPDYKALREDHRGPGRAIAEAEERLLLNVARSKPEWDAAFYAAMIAANTTARGSELKGLRLQDVNLVDREVTIRKSKTDAGARRIPLNAAAMWAFARLLERAGALGSVEPEHFLFPRCVFRATRTARQGTGYDPTQHQKTWRTAWRALVKETARRAAEGIVDESERQKAMAPFAGLRFHDLRHLAITKLAESEASDSTIMSIAGHLNRAMLEHYSHIRAQAKRMAVEAISSFVPEEPEPPAITKRIQ